uniref:Uncharacterized protein n=1 Tax=Arundo donax TaxID=35708 RepID=A0A0A9B4L0_ARUDO
MLILDSLVQLFHIEKVIEILVQLNVHSQNAPRSSVVIFRMFAHKSFFPLYFLEMYFTQVCEFLLGQEIVFPPHQMIS